MNKKTLFIILGLLVAGAAVAIYFYTKGSSRHLRLVPANASMVVSFDLKKLSDKSELTGRLKETKLYKTFMKEVVEEKGKVMNLLMAELFKHPLDNGLNIFSDMYLFMNSKGEDSYMGFVVDVKDQKDFESFIRKIPGLDKHIKKGQTYNVFSYEDNYWAWNENGLLILEKTAGYGDEKKQSEINMVNTLMNQDKKISMLEDKEFKKFADHKHDIGLFVNYGELMNVYGQMPGSNQVLKMMMENYKGIYISGGVSFENDKISMSSKTHGDQKAIDKISYLNKGGVDNKALKYITNNAVYAMFSMSLDMPRIFSMLGAEPNIKQGLEQSAAGMGMTVKELESVFTGELVLALVDIVEMETKTYDYKINEATGEGEMVEVMVMQPMPVFTMNLGIKDRNGFNKLIKNLPIPVVDGMRKVPLGYLPTFYAIETDYGMTFTNDSTLGASLVSNKKMAKEPDNEIAKLMTDKPTGVYMNLNLSKYPAVVSNYMKRSMGEEGFTHFSTYLSLFTDMKGSGDMKNASFEINLVKGDGNSLYRMLKQFDHLPLEKL